MINVTFEGKRVGNEKNKTSYDIVPSLNSIFSDAKDIEESEIIIVPYKTIKGEKILKDENSAYLECGLEDESLSIDDIEKRLNEDNIYSIIKLKTVNQKPGLHGIEYCGERKVVRTSKDKKDKFEYMDVSFSLAELCVIASKILGKNGEKPESYALLTESILQRNNGTSKVVDRYVYGLNFTDAPPVIIEVEDANELEKRFKAYLD